MEDKHEVFGMSLTETGIDNLACFLANNHTALMKGEKVKPPDDFNKPNKESESQIIAKWKTIEKAI